MEEPVKKKQRTLDSFLEKKAAKVEEKKSSPGPTIWSTIHENGLNISQAVVIDAKESKRLFLQLENEVWNGRVNYISLTDVYFNAQYDVII